MTLLDGKATAATIRAELKQQIDALLAAGQRAPHLVIVQVGNNPASETYVANKLKACAEVGIEAEKVQMDEQVSEAALLDTVHMLNEDPY